MREIVGDLFTVEADAVVVPINWRRNRQNHAIMGAGVALAAKKRWPELPWRLGKSIESDPTCPRVTHHKMPTDRIQVVTFPTKRDWRDPSDVDLIEDCLPALTILADHYGWQTVALPRLGCGLGQLDWESEVRPLLADLLDDRFIVVNPNTAAPAAEPGR